MSRDILEKLIVPQPPYRMQRPVVHLAMAEISPKKEKVIESTTPFNGMTIPQQEVVMPTTPVEQALEKGNAVLQQLDRAVQEQSGASELGMEAQLSALEQEIEVAANAADRNAMEGLRVRALSILDAEKQKRESGLKATQQELEELINAKGSDKEVQALSDLTGKWRESLVGFDDRRAELNTYYDDLVREIGVVPTPEAPAQPVKGKMLPPGMAKGIVGRSRPMSTNLPATGNYLFNTPNQFTQQPGEIADALKRAPTEKSTPMTPEVLASVVEEKSVPVQKSNDDVDRYNAALKKGEVVGEASRAAQEAVARGGKIVGLPDGTSVEVTPGKNGDRVKVVGRASSPVQPEKTSSVSASQVKKETTPEVVVQPVERIQTKEKVPDFSAAQSFAELNKMLREAGTVVGSSGRVYESQDLMARATDTVDVLQATDPEWYSFIVNDSIVQFPRAGNLRATVSRLLKKKVEELRVKAEPKTQQAQAEKLPTKAREDQRIGISAQGEAFKGSFQRAQQMAIESQRGAESAAIAEVQGRVLKLEEQLKSLEALQKSVAAEAAAAAQAEENVESFMDQLRGELKTIKEYFSPSQE